MSSSLSPPRGLYHFPFSIFQLAITPFLSHRAIIVPLNFSVNRLPYFSLSYYVFIRYSHSFRIFLLLLTVSLLMRCFNFVTGHPSFQKSASIDKFRRSLHSIVGYNSTKVNSDDNSGLGFSQNPSQMATSTATGTGPDSITDVGRPGILSRMQIAFQQAFQNVRFHFRAMSQSRHPYFPR